MRKAVARIALAIIILQAGTALATSEPEDGDIIFHTSRSAQSLAVQRATGSPYSHMGLIFIRNKKPYVLEAVQPVKYTALAAWKARGVNGHYVIKRLKKPLSAAQKKKLQSEAESFLGKPYDLAFEWSDSRIYCSELVWKAYERSTGLEIGTLQKLSEFRLDDPAVQRKMKERYGSRVPMNETVISPSAVYDSPQLGTVAKD